MQLPGFVHDLPELREAVRVFADRADAGRVLARMLAHHRGGGALVLGVPRGGVEVAASMADALGLPLDALVASKVSAPWNEEYAVGVVAADGTVEIDPDAARQMGLDAAGVEQAIVRARAKVERRTKELRGERHHPSLAGREVIVVDDGIATGATVLGAVKAARNAGASRVILAVPTAHVGSLAQFAGLVDALYVPNVRSGSSFGVSEAFERWGDKPIEEIRKMLDDRA